MACVYTYKGKTYDRDDFTQLLLKMKPSEAAKYMPGVSSVPNTPFKKTDSWTMLAFKRMVRYAAENGFDKIAWTTGEQQAERYDLSKQVDNIKYFSPQQGEYRLTIQGKDGEILISAENKYTLSEVEDLVGKEVAEKIKNGEGERTDLGDTILKNPDLKVGGHGMKAFYDKMLPSMVNKFFKKFGVKTEVSKIEGIGDQLSINITPELKQVALGEGLPLFQQSNKNTQLTKEVTNGRTLAQERTAPERTESVSKKISFEDAERDFYTLFGFRDKSGKTRLRKLRGKKYKQLEKIAELFGQQVFFFKTDNTKLKNINGFTSPGKGRAIFVNADSSNPLISIVGHELIHQLRANHKDLYDFLLNTIRVSDKNFQKYVDSQAGVRSGTFADIKNKDQWYEEFIGDFTSDQFHQVEFWGKLVDQNPSFTERIIDVLQNILDQIKRIFPRAEQLVSNLQESQDALAYALSESIDRINEIGEGAPGTKAQTIRNTDTKAFKDWFGDSKVVDENGDPLVVYHGSPDNFTEFDPSKTGGGHDVEGAGFYFTDDKAEADGYQRGKNGVTQEVYLNISNPVPLEGDINESEIRKIVLSSIGLTDESQINEWFDNNEDAFWESPLSNWSENPYSAYESVVQSILDQENPHEAFQTVWYDVFGADNKKYMKAMVSLGYDGVIIENESKHKGNDHYVVFDPTKIKSVYNQGTFDPNNPNILYSTSDDINEPISDKGFNNFISKFMPKFKGNKSELKHIHDAFRSDGSPFDVPETSTLFDTFVYKIGNQLSPLKKIQKAIESKKGKIEEYADALTNEMLRVSKTKAEIDESEKKHFVPIKRLIALSGKTVKDVDEYLYARHAGEANARLRLTNAKGQLKKLNDIRNDNLLLKAIEDIDKKFEKNPFSTRQSAYYDLLESELRTPKTEEEKKFKERWEFFKSKPSGMTDQEASEILEKYNSNIALKKIAEKFDAMNNERLDILLKSGRLSKEEFDAIKGTFKHWAPLKREGFKDTPSRGTGMQMLGRDIKVRGGSTKRAVNILANAMAELKTAHIKANKAEVARSFLNLVKENPNDDVWVIEKARKIPGYDSSGNIVEYNDMNVRDNEIKIKVDGDVHIISAQNEHAYRIIKGLKGDTFNTGPIMGALSKINRVLAMVNTTLSPEFMFTNFTRDIQTAAFNLSDTEISNMKKRVIKDIPNAMKGLRDLLRKEGKSDWAKIADRFKKAGGQIGWIDYAGDIDAQVKNLEKEINLYRDGHVTRKALHKAATVIEDYNTIVENAVRLSTFKNGIDAGMTEKKAALMAKDLTVNFNQKGVYGPLINSLYLFSNAGIQGSAKILSVLKNSPTARKMVYKSMVAASIMSIANRSIGGDDDDGVPFYDKIPDFEKERNMIFMLPGTNGKYVKIPLPWGYNVFWVAGSEVGDVLTEDRYNPTKSMANIISSISGAFNPIQSSTLLQTISPTITDPFVQMGENKTWYGAPLMPENNPFSRVKKPDSELYWPSARKMSISLARRLNELSGGNVIKPGYIDISPETLDLVLDTMTGSTGRFVADTVGLPAELISEGPNIKNIPFVRRFSGQKNDYSDTTEYRANVEHVFKLNEEIKAYPNKSKEITRDKTSSLFLLAKNTESKLAKINKAIKTSKSKKVKENLLSKKNDIMKKFNVAFYKKLE